ncbi:hypothetical protein D3C73_1187810 [compost metagenome]
MLLDVHVHQATGVDPGHDIENDTGLHVFDTAQGGIGVAGVDGGLADRNVVADLDLRLLVVQHHQRGGRKHLGQAACFQRAQGHLQVAADEGVEHRGAAQRDATGTQCTLAAAFVGDGGAGRIAGQAAQVPLHAQVQIAGELDFEDACFDLHLQRRAVQALDGRFDLFPLGRPRAYQ